MLDKAKFNVLFGCLLVLFIQRQVQCNEQECVLSIENTQVCISNDLPCSLENSIKLSSNFSWLDETIFQNGMSFSKSQYGFHNKTDSIRLCTCLEESPCIPIYCNGFEEINHCFETITNSPIFEELRNQHIFVLSIEQPACNKRIDIDHGEKLRIVENGMISVNSNSTIVYNFGEIYIGAIPDDELNFSEVYIMECSYNCGVDEDALMWYKNKIMLFVSVPALIITLAAYLSCRSLNESLQGKLVIFYVYGLAFTYLLFSLNHEIADTINSEVCKLMGYLSYLHILITFFAFNCMFIDIYCMFRSSDWAQTKERFLYYYIYILGMPLLLLDVVWMFDLFDIEAIKSANIKPKIGEESCFFTETGYAMSVYLYGPIILILLSSFILIILTAIEFIKINQGAPISQQQETDGFLSNDKKGFWLNVRLFIFMGLPWMIELTSHWLQDSRNCNLIWTYMFGDILLACLGLITFLLFMFTENMKQLMKRVLCSI